MYLYIYIYILPGNVECFIPTAELTLFVMHEQGDSKQIFARSLSDFDDEVCMGDDSEINANCMPF